MAAIGYGILIAALMGLSAFGAGWLVLQLKDKQSMRSIRLVQPDSGDAKVEEEIREGGFKQFNIEDIPPTASGMAQKFTHTRTHSEELRNVPK